MNHFLKHIRNQGRVIAYGQVKFIGISLPLPSGECETLCLGRARTQVPHILEIPAIIQRFCLCGAMTASLKSLPLLSCQTEFTYLPCTRAEQGKNKLMSAVLRYRLPAKTQLPQKNADGVLQNQRNCGFVMGIKSQHQYF